MSTRRRYRVKVDDPELPRAYTFNVRATSNEQALREAAERALRDAGGRGGMAPKLAALYRANPLRATQDVAKYAVITERVSV